ncbi:LysR family transcriptional regulator [Shinella sp.]|uniref:LysR family transcriptional regulator n=1 Tax=Shinella sp. TaxID=1870904 RepID=UPI0029AEEA9A|nr:LysR family transcriptional regulator [Shinella sp.]MDX3973780.1 LysR family transcriptional regulator [Shinella sp.]
MATPSAQALPAPSYSATIRHLRAFLSVAKHRSFTRAATELRLSQPSLTMTIQQLEDIVGGVLFDRTTRNVILTQEGTDLFPVAERVVDDFDLAIRNIRLTAWSRNSCVRVAVVSSIATKILPRILDGFLASRPGVRVQLREGNSNDVRRLVRRNEVDVGFASMDGDDAELVFKPLFRDQLGLFLRNDHALHAVAKDGVLRWADLANHNFVGLTPDTATGPILSQMEHLPESLRVPKLEVSTYPTLWALIENGLGITTAPALAAEFLPDNGIAFLGLTEPVAWRSVYIVSRLGRAPSPIVTALVAAIEQDLATIAKGHSRITTS